MVSVSPLHRRRGVLTSLMRRQLGELAAGGEAVAALWASDPVIYGRYGYGLAAWRQAFTVDTPASAFGPHGRALLAAGGVRPAPGDRPGGGTGGGAVGYNLHRTASSHADFVAAGTVTLQDLAAVTPAACAGLWRHLLDLDLITTWPRSTGRWPTRSRTCSPTTAGSATVGDALWVRVVDLPALAARAFAAPVDLLLEVTDELLVANAVRWRVVARSGAAAEVQRTGAEPDLSLALEVLGAAHLGGTPLVDLALAGRVVEHRPGALAEATRAWSWSPAPWCPKVF